MLRLIASAHAFSSRAMREISNRDWFWRTWIIQEVTLSAQLVVLTDSLQFSWNQWREMLVATCDWPGRKKSSFLRQPEDEIGRMGVCAPPPVMQMSMQSAYVGAGEGVASRKDDENGTSGSEMSPKRLFRQLLATANFKCKDPRDKLFAILPLFTGTLPSLLRPDYSKSLHEVFTDLTWYFINHGVLDALSLARGITNDTTSPTWAVDWANPQLHKIRNWASRSAGFTESHEKHFAWRQGGVLVLRGIVIGSVKTCWQESYFLTHEGHTGSGNELKLDDLICIFLGCATSFAVRRQSDQDDLLVGRCTVDDPGIMGGEAVAGLDWPAVEQGRLIAPLQDFRLC